ncbi:MAG: SIS domain-containing protein [bacterium]
MKTVILGSIQRHLALAQWLTEQVPAVEKAARLFTGTIKKGNTVFFCGNGGSAADSQHLAAEIVVRFRKERKAMPAVSLTTDTSILTAVLNDYGPDKVFSRQLEALARRGDLLVAISTSGNSANVLAAVRRAKVLGVRTLGLLGGSGGKIRQACDLSLVIPSSVTANVQEMHILIGHIFCDLAENN